MSEIREKEAAGEIIRWMLDHDIVPARFDIAATDEGWRVQGTAMGFFDGARHKFFGTASPDASTFMLASGAFGKLTEEGLDVFADLTGNVDGDAEDDARGWPEEALQ